MNNFYYTRDKKIFLNKVKAVEYWKQSKQDIHYYYHDDVYSKINWAIEPPSTLDFYYKEQAQRLRDEYDYVVLFYSGGYDSTNILETFYYNNIKLDKIVCVGAFKQDSRSGVDENHNGEIYHNAIPYITELGLEKITQLYDYTDYFTNISNFSVYEYGEQWVENVGPWYSPHNWFWKDIHKYVVPKHMEDKKVALIWGKDKPNLVIRNGYSGFYFTDVASLSYGGISSEPSNIDRINFYWDPKSPLILIKQLHQLKKLKEYINPNNLYSLKRTLNFKSPKSPTNILSLRDNFLKTKTNNSIFDFYNMGLTTLNKKISIKHDLDIVRSRFYPIDYGN